MTGPFLALMGDVPKKLARGKMLWVFLAIAVLAVAVVAGPLSITRDEQGVTALRMFGSVMTEAPPDARRSAEQVAQVIMLAYIGGMAYVLTCFCGVLTGILFFSDAVSSAFQPGAAETNLPKPISRNLIVVARYLGAVVSALGFATLVTGGLVGVTYARTGVFCATVLWAIPLSGLMFALLHAITSLGSVFAKNAIFGSFVGIGAWVLSWITQLSSTLPEKVMPQDPESAPPLMKKIAAIAGVAHRILPRASDLPDMLDRATDGRFGNDPTLGKSGEIEILAATAAWIVLAIGAACFYARRQDL